MTRTTRLLRPAAIGLLLALAVAACGPSASPSPQASASAAASSSASALPSVSGPLVTPAASIPSAGNGLIASVAPIPGTDMTCDPAGAHTGGLTGKVSLTLDAGGTLILASANIGVLAACKYWVYSDANGGLVIDAPAGARVTLGDFITIWRLTNPNDPVFGQFAIAMSGAAKSITVNGVSVAGDKWQNMPITDGMKIVATAAAAPTNPPTASPSPSATPAVSPSPTASA